jgi:hypothetical protein
MLAGLTRLAERPWRTGGDTGECQQDRERAPPGDDLDHAAGSVQPGAAVGVE